MSFLRIVFEFFLIIVKAIVLLLRLLVVLLTSLGRKAESRRRFRRELVDCGLPPDAVKKLSASYRDMVSLRDLSDIRSYRQRKS